MLLELRKRRKRHHSPETHLEGSVLRESPMDVDTLEILLDPV